MAYPNVCRLRELPTPPFILCYYFEKKEKKRKDNDLRGS